MAFITNIYTCPKCEESITATEKPSRCPACNCKLAVPGYNGFTMPTTITEQTAAINDREAHITFVLNMPIDITNDVMNDALNIIETIPGKKVKASDIRSLMGMAIKIGEIAKKYEEFLQAGGTHTPELFIKTSGDQNESQKTGDGTQTSTAVPTPLFTPVEQSSRGGS